jgi:hypothetical protein
VGCIVYLRPSAAFSPLLQNPIFGTDTQERRARGLSHALDEVGAG